MSQSRQIHSSKLSASYSMSDDEGMDQAIEGCLQGHQAWGSISHTRPHGLIDFLQWLTGTSFLTTICHRCEWVSFLDLTQVIKQVIRKPLLEQSITRHWRQYYQPGQTGNRNHEGLAYIYIWNNGIMKSQGIIDCVEYCVGCFDALDD